MATDSTPSVTQTPSWWSYLTGAFLGVILLPVARLLAHRLGVEGKHFKQIGYWKVGLLALVGMAVGGQLGLSLGVSMRAGFASTTTSMAVAFVGLIVPVMAWARHKAK